MGNCCSCGATVPSPPQITPMPVLSQPSTTSPPSRTRIQPSSNPESTHQDPNSQDRMKSLPRLPPSSPQNPRTQSATMSYPPRTLTSTVTRMLTDQSEFRILIVGKRGSGKSSLINAAFRVDMSATSVRLSADIDFAFRPDDNHRLTVHESSGLETGDIQGLRAIQDFISNRTDPSCAPRERLHAIWICVPSSDAINGRIGEGVEEILSMRGVPVVVAFTKSDLAFPQILGSDSGSSQYQDYVTSRAYAQCERLCRPLFRRDVPAVLVSAMPQYGALIDNLIVTMDRSIMDSRTASTTA